MSNRAAAIEYQERDFLLLRDLFVSRVMTLAHVAAIHFNGRQEAAKKRVQKLKATGLIGERPRKARDPGILFLSKPGFDLLQGEGRLSEFPPLSAATFEKRARVSELTLRHELAVMDAKAALAPAIRKKESMTVIAFDTWPMLYQFDVRSRAGVEVRVKPDGLIIARESTRDNKIFEHAFFLEVDRSTETVDTLADRAVSYREHYASGGFAASLGAPRSAYAEYPFRVLMVVLNDERRNNIAERLLSVNPPIETLVWLATAADLASDPLGAIWIRPRDYREAIKESDFVVSGREARGPYRRQAERERHIREHARMRALFDD